MKLRLHPKARAEIAAAARWLDREQAGLGEALIAEFEASAKGILQFPAAGARELSKHDGVRRRLLERFRYKIVYIVQGDVVFVLALAHTSRKPGYWTNRV